MKTAIMQPYIFPYIGYFQLIKSVNQFVVYDNIQYTKKGFINRNKILFNSSDRLFTIPIKKDSDYLNVVSRVISNNWKQERIKFLNLIIQSYKKAPYFSECFDIIEQCIKYDDFNLFNYIYNSIKSICTYLDIDTKIIVSSQISCNHDLKSQDKVLDICKSLNTKMYINAIGGVTLYDKDIFKHQNIELKFIKSNLIEYNQFNNKFVPWLSIIDVMMFNSKNEINDYLKDYTLI